MRGGPGAQTPGNGGMKKHNPVTVELRNLQSLLQCDTRRRRRGRAPGPGMKIFENSPAGRSNSSTDELFELTHPKLVLLRCRHMSTGLEKCPTR